MKKQLAVILAMVVFVFAGFISVDQSRAEDLSSKLKGRILLQIESHGEAWYVNPKDSKRYYMADGSAAYNIMRDLGVGVTNINLAKIKTNKTFAKTQQGKIFLQIESHGEAWYIDTNGVAHYLKDGATAYSIMRELGLGIKTADLIKINLADKDKTTSSVPAGDTTASPLTCTSPSDTSRMDIFDSHAHVGEKVSADKMIQEMDKAGVSVTNLYGDDSLSFAAISQYPGRFITFVTTPESPDPATWSNAGQAFVASVEKKLKTGKYYGVGETNLRYYGGGRAPIAPPDVSVPADDPIWLKLVDLSAKYHVPISFHFTPEDPVANAAFEKMLSHNKDTILIWAHLGFNQMPLDSAILTDFLLRYPHLYFDTAGIQGMQNPPIGKGIQNPDANWDRIMPNGQLTKEWKQFFETWNSRIMVASDAGGGKNSLERWLNYSSNTTDGAPSDAIGHWRSLTSYLDYDSARNILSANSRKLFLKEQKKPYTYSVSSNDKCYSISVSSDSSISALTFNPSARTITFTAADSNGTTGQAVITIPTALAGGKFTVFVNGQSVKSQSTSNSANTTISLEYGGGIKSITLSAPNAP